MFISESHHVPGNTLALHLEGRGLAEVIDGHGEVEGEEFWQADKIGEGDFLSWVCRKYDLEQPELERGIVSYDPRGRRAIGVPLAGINKNPPIAQ